MNYIKQISLPSARNSMKRVTMQSFNISEMFTIKIIVIFFFEKVVKIFILIFNFRTKLQNRRKRLDAPCFLQLTNLQTLKILKLILKKTLFHRKTSLQNLRKKKRKREGRGKRNRKRKRNHRHLPQKKMFLNIL